MERKNSMKVSIHFGIGNSVTKEYASGTTVSQVLGDANLRAVLGYGDNVRAVIDGVPQPGTSELSEGDAIHVETNVACKA